MPRMVKTPWLETPVPFQEAARIGTQKVIRDHATIGIVITTDGSFGELPRSSFLEAEKETITELQKIGKPFLVIVNSAEPSGEAALDTAQYLKEQYHVAPMILNCEKMGKRELNEVFEQFLLEFPLTRVIFHIPGWVETLEEDHWAETGPVSECEKDNGAFKHGAQYIPGGGECDEPLCAAVKAGKG